MLEITGDKERVYTMTSISAIFELENKRENLVDRLDKNADYIEQQRKLGADVTELEDLWISLLHEYEGVCDQIRKLYTPEVLAEIETVRAERAVQVTGNTANNNKASRAAQIFACGR